MLTSFHQQKKKAHLTIALNETQESILQEYMERRILPFFDDCLEASQEQESLKNTLITLADSFIEENFRIFSHSILQKFPQFARSLENLHNTLFPQQEEEKAHSPFGEPYRSIFDGKICDRTHLTAFQMRETVAESFRVKIKAFLTDALQKKWVENNSLTNQIKHLRA